MPKLLVPLLLAAAAATPAMALPDILPSAPPAIDSSSGGLRQSNRPLPHVLRNRLPTIGDSPQQGSEPPLRLESRRPRETNWSTGWRSDRRYDWASWRSRHRSIFNVGDYYDPFGWGYRRYSVGRRLWPAYYADPFWIQDPYYFRLPYAPAGYRWVRYYNDAVLIDTWDGRVADVVHNFFW